jgi:hypothetical protein
MNSAKLSDTVGRGSWFVAGELVAGIALGRAQGQHGLSAMPGSAKPPSLAGRATRGRMEFSIARAMTRRI